ncbi:MAG: ASPIC/UnbV domain-containing protein [Bacteroidales bacterium]
MGEGVFVDAAPYVSNDRPFDSRSVALADLWNRGVLDVVVANQNDRLRIYKNHTPGDRHWIAFEAPSRAGQKNPVGTQVQVFWNGQSQTQVINGGIGFSSQNQRRLHFGLGSTARVDSVRVIWPDGLREVMPEPGTDRLHVLSRPAPRQAQALDEWDQVR